MKSIGIIGGTFNPIHNGHLKLAEVAREIFNLDKIVFIPTGTPPHKGLTELVEKEHRYNMVKLAIKGTKGFDISRIELNRSGYSYAIDTFNILKKKYGKGTKLYYIMGLDSINEILSWKKPIELLKICNFIVATRPKSKIRTFKRLLKFPPIAKYSAHIHLIEMNMDISASDIRKKIKSDGVPSGILPKAVADYISKNKLYKEQQ